MSDTMPEYVRAALWRGVGFLLRAQRSDGSFGDTTLTAHVAAAMRAAGEHGISAAAGRARLVERVHGSMQAIAYPIEEIVARQAPTGYWDDVSGERHLPEGEQRVYTTASYLSALAAQPRAASIFADGTQEQLFLRDGYTVVDYSLLDKPHIDELLDIHRRFATTSDGLSISVYADPVTSRTATDDAVMQIIEQPLRTLLPRHRFLTSTFITKTAGGKNRVPWHHDSSYVDPAHSTTVHAWFPLRDVAVTDGCLHVVPGSHLIWLAPRAPGIGFPWCYVTHSLDNDFAVALPLKSGGAILTDHRLIHGSPPNRSATTRIALAVVMVAENAPLRYYHAIKSQAAKPPDSSLLPPAARLVPPSDRSCEQLLGAPTSLEVYAVDDAFCRAHVLGERPRGLQPMDRIDVPPPPELPLYESTPDGLRPRPGGLRPFWEGPSQSATVS